MEGEGQNCEDNTWDTKKYKYIAIQRNDDERKIKGKDSDNINIVVILYYSTAEQSTAAAEYISYLVPGIIYIYRYIPVYLIIVYL